MDVHPTKNVSIGIDPYPYIYIYYDIAIIFQAFCLVGMIRFRWKSARNFVVECSPWEKNVHVLATQKWLDWDWDLPGLVNIPKTMDRSTMFKGKTHYFDRAILQFANC